MSIDLWVDFNDTDGQGHVATLRKFASRDFLVGERIQVGDGAGDVCSAIVLEADDRYIFLSLDLGSMSYDSTAVHATV